MGEVVDTVDLVGPVVTQLCTTSVHCPQGCLEQGPGDRDPFETVGPFWTSDGNNTLETVPSLRPVSLWWMNPKGSSDILGGTFGLNFTEIPRLEVTKVRRNMEKQGGDDVTMCVRV